MSEQSLGLTPIITEMTVSSSSFRDIVLDRQRKWRTLKKNPRKEFSQAADIPEAVSRNLLGLVIDNLPSYVPEELKIKLRQTHPDPIVAVGVLADKRTYYDKEQYMLPDLIFPENIEGKENQQAYERGIILLDEVATDALAKDCLLQLGKKHKWFRPVAALINNIIPSNYKKELKKVEKIFGGKEKFEIFRQSLILAMLTGENDSVNEQLKGLGYDNLDQFAVEMGKSVEDLAVLRDFFEKINISSVGGRVSPAFPGVLNFPLTHTLIASFNTAVAVGFGYVEQLAIRMNDPAVAVVGLLLLAPNSYWALRLGSGLPYAVIHETCHYLGQETSHFGLKTIEYSGKSE